MKTHLIYGVPGTGKSLMASQLAKRLSMLFIELDDVRHDIFDSRDPYLHTPSTLAWQRIGELNKNSAIEGFLHVRTALEPFVSAKLRSIKDDYVAEAAFVSPNLASSGLLLIAVRSEEQHYKQFFVHRTPSHQADQQFKAARFIQKYLIEEADNLGAPIFYNDGDANRNIDRLLALLDPNR